MLICLCMSISGWEAVVAVLKFPLTICSCCPSCLIPSVRLSVLHLLFLAIALLSLLYLSVSQEDVKAALAVLKFALSNEAEPLTRPTKISKKREKGEEKKKAKKKKEAEDEHEGGDDDDDDGGGADEGGDEGDSRGGGAGSAVAGSKKRKKRSRSESEGVGVGVGAEHKAEEEGQREAVEEDVMDPWAFSDKHGVPSLVSFCFVFVLFCFCFLFVLFCFCFVCFVFLFPCQLSLAVCPPVSSTVSVCDHFCSLRLCLSRTRRSREEESGPARQRVWMKPNNKNLQLRGLLQFIRC